jgi:hypothetical protein
MNIFSTGNAMRIDHFTVAIRNIQRTYKCLFECWML